MATLTRRNILQAAAVAAAAGPSAIAMAKPRTEKNFILVHGGFHGGWCYARVAKLLRAQGHAVYTPTLTGLGERSHLGGGAANVSVHIQDVVNVMQWERLDDVVLCGHSYGGIIIGAVADRMPKRVASLVYLDAAVPEHEMSLLDLMKPEEMASMFSSAAAYGGQFVPPAPAAAFNVNPADRPMVDALCTPQPIATFTERVKLSGAQMKIAKKTYIRATGWQGQDIFRQLHTRFARDPAWRTCEIPCGHDVMLDAPERLTEILLDSA